MSKAAELANLIGNINAGGGGVNRNVIINGAMNVAQRSTSETGVGSSGGYLVCDRWQLAVGNTDGRLTMSQDSSVPTGEGFANSLKLDCTTADTSIAAAENLVIQQKIEGQNLQSFAKGTSSAKPFAVSFYVKGNGNATYMCELRDRDNDRHNTQQFAVTSSWNRIELTFSADTTGAFDDDNASSLELRFWLHAGSDYSGGSYTANTWASTTNANRAAGISSFFDSTDRTFFITGVQLEVGQNPTSFEHISNFGEELARCQRYFTRILGNQEYIGQNFAGDVCDITIFLPTTMRSQPSIVVEDAQNTANKASVYQSGSYTHGISSAINTGRSREHIVLMRNTGTLSPSGTVDDAVQVQFDDFQADAEL